MSDKLINFTKSRKFRFDFVTDEKLYVITFEGKILQEDVRKMLLSVQKQSYENMRKSLRSYMVKHHLEYSHLVSMEIPLGNGKVMGWAEHLLHSDNCDRLDENIKDADVFFSVIDYQQTTSDGYCEGCYLIVKRLFSVSEGYKYNIIGQTFFSTKQCFEEQGYFAIRKNNATGHLQDIDTANGKPVLPALGCVDVMGLLLSIENIKNKEQAAIMALK